MYHEAFWTAAAAAAPVIALAAIVSLTDTARPLGPHMFGQESYKIGADKLGALRWLLWLGYGVGFANLVLQALTLLFALQSLAAGHDRVRLGFAEVTATLGIGLLLLSGLLVAALRIGVGVWLPDPRPPASPE